MSDFIKLASPNLNESDINNVIEVLRSGNLVQGEKVVELEKKVSDFIGVSECIAVTNGTSSLHLILEALGIGPGDEVIIPAFSYIATANAVELVGAKPIFVDIDLNTFNIKTSKIEEKINDSTKGIMIVHEFGLCADLIKISKICQKHNIHLIEDAACALGAKEGNFFAGSVGIAGSFSFHPRKAITSGEGGAIVTNDKKIAVKLRALRNHGIDSENKKELNFIYAGHNFRMTDIQASLLLGQIDRIEYILSKKSKIANNYIKEINNRKFILPKEGKDKKHAWQTFHILLNKRIKQKDLIEKLYKLGIGTNIGAQCIPFQTFFKNKYKHDNKNEFPNALYAYKYGLAIPLYESLKQNQVEYIIEILNKI